MNYSLENLKKLRKVTGVSIKKCIEALKLKNDNFEESLEWLKDYSAKVSKISSNDKNRLEENKCGLVIFEKNENLSKAVSFILKCESDLVEKSLLFQNLSQEMGNLAIKNFDFLSNSKDPALSLEKISEEKIGIVSASTREKIFIKKISFFSKKEKEEFGIYVHHNKKLGSIVITENCDKDFAHQVALYVAVNKPEFISKESISKEELAKKVEQIKSSLLNEIKEKNERIISRIIDGKLNKWYSENCLFEQFDFREQDKKIGELVSDKKANVKKIFFLEV